MKVATISTNRGAIKLELFDGDCPKLVANFEKLAKSGFYNGVLFHRVIPDFMIQGGDPNSKGKGGAVGSGGPGYQLECEIVPARKHQKGSLAMAHTGSCAHDKATGAKVRGTCTNGSQFYITHLPTPHLDGKHTVFGQVLEGQDVVDAIKQGDKIDSIAVSG